MPLTENISLSALWTEHPEWNSLSDAEVCAILNNPVYDKLDSRMINFRTILDELGLELGMSIITKLKAAASSNPLLSLVVPWLEPDKQGVDICSNTTRHAIVALTANEGILSVTEGDCLLAMAEPSTRSVGWHEMFHLRPATYEDVKKVRNGE